jgi:hypothetical protein
VELAWKSAENVVMGKNQARNSRDRGGEQANRRAHDQLLRSPFMDRAAK